jgi:hypothetical protein
VNVENVILSSWLGAHTKLYIPFAGHHHYLTTGDTIISEMDYSIDAKLGRDQKSQIDGNCTH